LNFPKCRLSQLFKHSQTRFLLKETHKKIEGR
jgi:hypothetical protein